MVRRQVFLGGLKVTKYLLLWTIPERLMFGLAFPSLLLGLDVMGGCHGSASAVGRYYF
jgi:hypothetical protein